ncbi:MAG: helix-turn-helix transcriptional regulator [Pseudomonadales bacterium]|nr:helix-turn-helix transcriptional regulator [Pseudomonadales bacterium]
MMTQDSAIKRKIAPGKTGGLIESIFRCKWSLTVLDLITNDIKRPGEMVRTVEGLSTKVLNDCLRTNVKFGILEKQSFAEIPPRVEYHFTEYGQRFVAIIQQIQKLEDEMIQL